MGNPCLMQKNQEWDMGKDDEMKDKLCIRCGADLVKTVYPIGFNKRYLKRIFIECPKCHYIEKTWRE